jgi:hypothetical protein
LKSLYIKKTNYVMMISDEVKYLDRFIDGLSDEEIDEINTCCRDDSEPVPFRAFARDIGIEL